MGIEKNTPICDLESEIKACQFCLEQPWGDALPHPPRPVLHLSSTARLCIAGQAPGTRVHQSGLPFTDPSGERLRQWMAIDEKLFYDKSKLAIVPMGFCFPGLDKKGGDLPPRRECRALWHERIFSAMPQIELILVIGQYAQDYHLGAQRQKTLTATVMAWEQSWSLKRRPRVLPLPHPSWRNSGWLKKNPWFEKDLLPVLRQEVARLMQ